MSAPEQPTTGGTPTRGHGYTPVTGARMPIPGNAEFLVFFLIWVFLIILWAASDQVDAGLFSILTTVLTFGYLLSRGIAKASRVLEQ
jgi:hypothetical protein